MDTPGRRSGITVGTTRLVAGLVLILAGTIFLLGLADVVDAWDIIGGGWPVILIVFGVVHYLNSRQLPGALVVAGLGVVLLLFSLDVLPGSATAVIWPLLLIVVGIWLMLGRQRTAGATADDTVSSFSMFSDVELVRQSQAFAGGTVAEIFGDTTLDLRQARLAPDGAKVDVLAMFADVDILVPQGWRIDLNGIPLLGEYSNKTEQAGELPAEAPTLSINVLAILAEVNVRN